MCVIFNFRRRILTVNHCKSFFTPKDKCFPFILDLLLHCGEFQTRAVMKNAALKNRPELTVCFPGRRRFRDVDQRCIHGNHTSKSFQECWSSTMDPGQRQRLHPVVNDCHSMAVQLRSDKGGKVFIGNYIKKMISASYHILDCCCKVPRSALWIDRTTLLFCWLLPKNKWGLLRLWEGQAEKKQQKQNWAVLPGFVYPVPEVQFYWAELPSGQLGLWWSPFSRCLEPASHMQHFNGIFARGMTLTDEGLEMFFSQVGLACRGGKSIIWVLVFHLRSFIYLEMHLSDLFCCNIISVQWLRWRKQFQNDHLV